jgi:hypothetical protein
MIIRAYSTATNQALPPSSTTQYQMLITEFPVPITFVQQFTGVQPMNLVIPNKAIPAGARYILADVFVTMTQTDCTYIWLGKGSQWKPASGRGVATEVEGS